MGETRMRFRVAFVVVWALAAVAGMWFLHGGFGIRVPRGYQSWLPANVSPWILWLWALALVGVGSLLVAYLLVRGMQVVLPRLISN